MIISASRRTDIPAFLGKSFFKALAYYNNILVRNPFNRRQIKEVELTPDTVDAIVFWSKYPKGIIKHLDDISALGYDYMFLYTLTGYGPILEEQVPRVEKTIEVFKKLSDKIGSDKVIWRYDPIVYSNITDDKYHIENFSKLAKELSSYTNKVIISFLDFYEKLLPRFKGLENDHQITISDIMQMPEKAITLASRIREIAESHNLEIQSCAEEELLANSGIKPGGCIDCEYLSKIFNKRIHYPKDKNQRKTCKCCQSVDIGEYGNCCFRCMYCYAI